MHRILLVEDSRDDADLFGFALDDAGLAYELRVVGSERELRDALAAFAPTVVISATCGRAMRDRGAISPGLLIPISMMAKSVSWGMRAKVSGTPQWLL